METFFPDLALEVSSLSKLTQELHDRLAIRAYPLLIKFEGDIEAARIVNPELQDVINFIKD